MATESNLIFLFESFNFMYPLKERSSICISLIFENEYKGVLFKVSSCRPFSLSSMTGVLGFFEIPMVLAIDMAIRGITCQAKYSTSHHPKIMRPVHSAKIKYHRYLFSFL